MWQFGGVSLRVQVDRTGGAAQSPDALWELIRDVSDAPMRLLDLELPGRVLHHTLKDRFGVRDALHLDRIRPRLAEKLWEEIATEHIARSVSEAIEIHEALLERSFGDFLARRTSSRSLSGRPEALLSGSTCRSRCKWPLRWPSRVELSPSPRARCWSWWVAD